VGCPADRQDAPDAVHQMRVAIRRMRSVLRAYGRVVDRAATRELTGAGHQHVLIAAEPSGWQVRVAG